MALIYVGEGKYIGGIPAQDISDAELGEMLKSGVAEAVCGKQVSLAEFEGVLIKGGLYKTIDSDKRPAKLHKPQ